jgi:hypothetical protein
MKLKYGIFTVLFVLAVGNAFADELQTCLQKVQQSGNFMNDIKKIIVKDENLNKRFIEENMVSILSSLAVNMYNECGGADGMLTIAKYAPDKEKIGFLWGEKRFGFNIDIPSLFKLYKVQTAILVSPNPTYQTNDSISRNSIKQKFWPNTCSDYYVFQGISQKSPVSNAGKRVFTEFSGKYFIDFPEGYSRKFFPGVILTSKWGNVENGIVLYTDLRLGIQRAKQFSKTLGELSTECKGLYVYLVGIGTPKEKISSPQDTTDDTVSPTTGPNTGTAIGVAGKVAAGSYVAGIIGGAAYAGGMSIAGSIAIANLGLSIGAPTALNVIGTAAGSAWAAGAGGATLGIAGSVSWIPVAGWIISGVALATAAAIAVAPKEIADPQELVILSGPYMI